MDGKMEQRLVCDTVRDLLPFHNISAAKVLFVTDKYAKKDKMFIRKLSFPKKIFLHSLPMQPVQLPFPLQAAKTVLPQRFIQYNGHGIG